jgi:hypothetical protein
MVTLTRDAQSQLAHYLRQMRSSLRGNPSIDADDVERDVLGHIDAELQGEPEPVDAGLLHSVLERLGAPHQWAADDQSAWWAVFARLRNGPESWRLTYLSFALGAAGLTMFLGDAWLWPLPILLPAIALLFARASIELLDHQGEPIGARRWLIYPVLLPWYVGLGGLAAIWPLVIVEGVITDPADAPEWVGRSIPEPLWASGIAIGAIALGLWWILWGLVLRRAPWLVSATFRPFADDFNGRHAAWLSFAGVLVAAVGGGVLALLLT